MGNSTSSSSQQEQHDGELRLSWIDGVPDEQSVRYAELLVYRNSPCEAPLDEYEAKLEQHTAAQGGAGGEAAVDRAEMDRAFQTLSDCVLEHVDLFVQRRAELQQRLAQVEAHRQAAGKPKDSSS